MATTANHPDGSFITPAEPDEDIATIAKQISDHAEVIYQTWKSRGLAPNEILTCHNNINAVDEFGSVLTSSFSLPNHNSTKLPSNASPEMECLYNNSSAASMNATNLEHIVNKFVVEDKARLAARQKNDASGAPSTAKNYPSSIQHVLQKFEKRSPDDAIAKCALRSDKTNNSPLLSNKSVTAKPKSYQLLPEINEKNPPEQFIPINNTSRNNVNDTYSSGVGASTWPLKTKSLSEIISDNLNVQENFDYIQKSSTLPSRMEKKTSPEEFLDEVAKEEERLINALKTGMVITANDSKFTPRSTANKGIVNKIHTELVNDLEKLQKKTKISDSQFGIKTKSKPTGGVVGSEKIENYNKSELLGNDTVCGMSSKRNRRSNPLDIINSEAGNTQQRLNLRMNSTNTNFNNPSGNPVRPFLTRGSVAERVMMFEKCPTEILEKRTRVNNVNTASWKNLASDVHTKIQTYSKETNQRKTTYPPHTTLQRHTKANKNVFIPRFHYPHGKPISQQQQSITFKSIEEAFRSLPNLHATKEQFSTITKACGCPLYWKAALFIACGGEKLEFVEMNTFLEYWRDLTSICNDDGSRFMRIVTRSTKRSYIIPEDLIPLVQDVVNTHPSLTFLKQAPEFHSRYVHTVICRVYYCVNQSWNGQISLTELRKSDFLRAIQLLEEEEDINQVTAYFSYEHFYVIYCKFWELDRDHDLFISKEDLARHSDHALSTRIIDRIFSRTKSKTRNSMLQEGKMSYTDFVIFLLAEEDKRHPRAIEYWFRCMDLDGDGFLSMYELEYFYDEQLQRMEAMGIECLPFEDCLCQMLDMIQPRNPGKISLSDLKRCKMTPIFFDTFFNLEKYLDHEQRDPFASQRDQDNDISDWDRYAAEEYELLVAEESGNDHCNDIEQYNVIENNEEDDIFSSNLDDILNGPREFVNNNTFKKQNNMYLAENFLQPSMLVTDYCDKPCNSDSSDDYAGDSDDCSL